MFFKPELALHAHTGADYDCYSDWHKEAFGCRPGARQSLGYSLMEKEDRRKEHATVDAWLAEDGRISALRTEVARFDFSRRMQYLMRREGVSEREAFIQTCSRENVEFLGNEHGFEWGFVCYTWNLPYSDEAVLKAKWDELNAKEA